MFPKVYKVYIFGKIHHSAFQKTLCWPSVFDTDDVTVYFADHGKMALFAKKKLKKSNYESGIEWKTQVPIRIWDNWSSQYQFEKKRLACILQTRGKWPYFEVYRHYTSQNLLTLAYLTFFRCVLKFLMCVQLTKNLAKNMARNLARKWQKKSGEKNDQNNGRGKCVKNANTRFEKKL